MGHRRHTPPTQDSPAPQGRLQPPQWESSVWTSAQLPVTHSRRPVVHRQVPLRHSCPLAQARPHAPQCCSSEVVSAQVPSHVVSVLAHPHRPARHGRSPSHARSHSPQWSGSTPVFTQRPSHSVAVAGHSHAPSSQRAPAGHALSQAPQCRGSSSRTISPSQRRQVASRPSQSLSMPSPQTSSPRTVHTQIEASPSDATGSHDQPSDGGQCARAVQARVHTPRSASTARHRLEAQSSVRSQSAPSSASPASRPLPPSSSGSTGGGSPQPATDARSTAVMMVAMALMARIR